jgi:hypothetical protein
LIATAQSVLEVYEVIIEEPAQAARALSDQIESV